MTRSHRRRRALVGALLALSMVAAACGDDEDDGGDTSSGDTGTDTGTETTDGAETTEGGGDETEVSDEDLNLTMGGSASSSSVFAFITAQARIAGEVDGNMNINVRETGASSENIQLLRDGAVDFGLSGLSTVIQAQRGLAQFEGSAYDDLCLVMNYLKNGEFITVRADADIDNVEDLDGMAFAPSFQGSALYDNILAYFAVLGIEVEVFDGSLEDIVNAMKDGRIVGFGKSGNGLGADASMLDVASTVPVEAIGFTEEQVEQIFAASPDNELLYQFTEVEPGSIYDNEESFLTPVVLATYFGDSSLDEDTSYRLARGLWEAQEDAATQTNYAGAMGITIQDTLDSAEKLPFCPGADRYFEEDAGA